MSKLKLLIILIFLYGQTYAQTEYIRDLDSFSTLASKHKNLYATITKPQFDKQIEDVRQQLKEGLLDRAHFIVVLMKINAQIADEHTILFPVSSNKFPFEFYHYSEGIFLIKTDSSHQRYLLSELVAIDGMPISQIIALFKNCIKTDNESYFKRWSVDFMSYKDVLTGLDIIKGQQSTIFSFKGPTGEVSNIAVNTMPGNTYLLSNTTQGEQLRYSQDKNYWYSFDTTRNILYFNYEHCQEDSVLTFSRFNKMLFKTINKNKPIALILDLRQNEGGSSAILSSFIKKIKSSYLNKNNKIFVLIGRQTFSSALMNAIEIKQKTSAIFLGEPTGANINHYGELRTFSLPNSKLFITYSTNYFENWKDKQGPLLPDYYIPSKLTDVLTNRDSCLEMVYRLCK